MTYTMTLTILSHSWVMGTEEMNDNGNRTRLYITLGVIFMHGLIFGL